MFFLATILTILLQYQSFCFLFNEYFLPSSTVWAFPLSDFNQKLVQQNNCIIYEYFSNYMFPMENQRQFEINFFWGAALSKKHKDDYVLKETQQVKYMNIECLYLYENKCIKEIEKLNFYLQDNKLNGKFQINLVADKNFRTYINSNINQFSNVIINYKTVNDTEQYLLQYFQKNGINLPYMLIDNFIDHHTLIENYSWSYLENLILFNGLFFIPISINVAKYTNSSIHLMLIQEDAKHMKTTYMNLEKYFTNHYMDFSHQFLLINLNALVYKIFASGEHLQFKTVIVYTDKKNHIQNLTEQTSIKFYENSHFHQDAKYLQWKNWQKSNNFEYYFHNMHYFKYETYELKKKNLIIGVLWNHQNFMQRLEALFVNSDLIIRNSNNSDFIILVPENEYSEIKSKFSNYSVQFAGFPIPHGGMNNNNRFLEISKFLKSHPIYNKIVITDITDIAIQTDPFHLMPNDNYFLIANQNHIPQGVAGIYKKEGSKFFGESIGYSLNQFDKICAGTIGGDYHSIILVGYLINEFSTELKHNQVYWIYLSIFKKQALHIYSYNNGYLFLKLNLSKFKKKKVGDKLLVYVIDEEIFPAIIHQGVKQVGNFK